MKERFTIPKELSHLRVDQRGYPIPYFVAIIDGVPNFRVASFEKLKYGMEHHICGICGKKLPGDYSYIISGPIGMKNQVSTDLAMHRVCAEFALEACPHIYFEKAERKDTVANVEQPHVMLAKPKELMLIKVRTKFKWARYNEGIFRYTYMSHEVYHYEDGILTKKI